WPSSRAIWRFMAGTLVAKWYGFGLWGRIHSPRAAEGPDHHPRDEHDADAVAGRGAGPRHDDEGGVPADGRERRHEDGAEPGDRGLAERGELRQAAFLQGIGELDDEDPVLGDQTDERDQPHLRVDVDRREPEEAEEQGARDRQRHGA